MPIILPGSIHNPSSGLTAPSAWGDAVNDAILNLANQIDDTAWVFHSPTWQNLTIGNGSHYAAYKKIGRVVHYRGSLYWGSTTSATTGATRVSIPITGVGHTPDVFEQQVGICFAQDASANYVKKIGICQIAPFAWGDYMSFHGGNFDGDYWAGFPMTWAATDQLIWYICYESAS